MRRLPDGILAWPLVAASLVLLNASLTFANVWPTPQIRWRNALSIELAVLVLLFVALPRARTFARRALPGLWLLLVLGHYLDVTAPSLYGRDFNLYWDAPHLGNVVAMIAEAAPAWQIGLALISALLAIALAYVVSRAALGWLLDATKRPRLRSALASAALLVVALFLGQSVVQGGSLERHIVFAEPVTEEYIHQVRSVLAMIGPDATAPTLPASPDALSINPAGLAGADVQLIFVESYGAITFDAPEISTTLAASRAALDDAVRETRRTAVSAYVESPTFGGSSWLAHLSLLSGIGVRDPYSYQSLMAEQRQTLSTTFSRAGYRSVALMPGMRQAWPEGAFYHYATIYGRDDLEYPGPRFGWWSIPDQFSLAKLDALEGPPDSRAPLFVVFPTSTTHAPFGPVAPYQPDWSKVLRADAYDPNEVEAILARPPDLTNLSRDYAHAMAYEFTTFAGYLRKRANDPLVMILVGDHQPPAAVSGRQAPWTVPVHVITSNQAVTTRLIDHGFQSGFTPVRPAIGDMHELVPILLSSFSATGNPRP